MLFLKYKKVSSILRELVAFALLNPYDPILIKKLKGWVI